MQLRVKVCGFTVADDVQAGLVAGVDAFGFNFAKGPRKIGPDQAAPLVAGLTPFHTAVALFVDADEDEILSVMQATRCQVVQLHGDEPPELAAALSRRFPVLKAARIRSAADLERLRAYPADAYLLDAYVPGQAGGTGQVWDHSLLDGLDLGRPVILAGGLTPDNVAKAVEQCRPAGVDTASGVESSPGRKDPAAMAAFVAAAQSI